MMCLRGSCLPRPLKIQPEPAQRPYKEEMLRLGLILLVMAGLEGAEAFHISNPTSTMHARLSSASCKGFSCCSSSRIRPVAVSGLRMTATAEAKEILVVEPPSIKDMESLPMGYSAILNELEEMRTRDIFGAMKKGDINTIEASTLTLKRMGRKMFGKKVKEDKKSASFMEGGWSKRGKGSSILRTIEIYSFCIKIVLRELKLRKVEDKALKSSTRLAIAADLKQGLLELGPTFIKLGQLLSTRIDILPREYIDELKQLQDNVPGFSGDKAVKVIEQELGKPIDSIFDSFDRVPLAAASLGQVRPAPSPRINSHSHPPAARSAWRHRRR
jgi:hypothetical protein